MIQRIQSLYLFLAATLIGAIFFFPLAELADKAGTTYTFFYRGLYGPLQGANVLIENTTLLALLFMLIFMLILFNIFLFKYRSIQMKICIANILLLVISIALAYFELVNSFAKYNSVVHYNVIATFPLVVLILLFLAYRAIKKDEKLVRSIDRIR
jgi:hypothetical protein